MKNVNLLECVQTATKDHLHSIMGSVQARRDLSTEEMYQAQCSLTIRYGLAAITAETITYDLCMFYPSSPGGFICKWCELILSITSKDLKKKKVPSIGPPLEENV